MPKSRTRTKTRWVIVGMHGLYTGQWLTRKDAIREHCEAKGVPTRLNGEVNGFKVCETDEERAQAWTYWRRQGDRAVKARITWEAK